MIVLDEATLRRLCESALHQSVQQEMRNRPALEAIRAATTSAIAANSAAINEAVGAAFRQALLSPDLVQVIKEEMQEAIRRKFVGEFDGVIRSAAKSAAIQAIETGSLRNLLLSAGGQMELFGGNGKV